MENKRKEYYSEKNIIQRANEKWLKKEEKKDQNKHHPWKGAISYKNYQLSVDI